MKKVICVENTFTGFFGLYKVGQIYTYKLFLPTRHADADFIYEIFPNNILLTNVFEYRCSQGYIKFKDLREEKLKRILV